MKHLLAACLLIALLAGVQVTPAPAQDSTPYWPTEGWRTSTPEAQGMDSRLLADLLTMIHDEGHSVHSVLIIRNGYLVAESYLYPYDEHTLHDLRSASKSFTSALVGIAIDRKLLPGVNTPLLFLFPGRTVQNLNDAKRAITLKDVLTMSSGLSWPGGIQEPVFNEMYQADDWVQFVLDRPMSYAPGSTFAYNSGGSHLLAALVEQAVARDGQHVMGFAWDTLFGPLGFADARWNTSPAGIVMGGSGLFLTPRDMAKFGYLYLHHGEWDGQQIVSAAWVADSTRAQIAAEPAEAAYGYQWWVNEQDDYYTAAGYGGQQIFVHPGLNLVIVLTAAMPLAPMGTYRDWLERYVFPAAQSDGPLPENPAGVAALQAAEALSRPNPAAAPELPALAARVSGKVYALEENAAGWKTLCITFDRPAAEAEVAINGEWPLHVGLDGAFRGAVLPSPLMRTLPGTRIMGRGTWRMADTFAIELQIVGDPDPPIQAAVSFEGDTLRAEVTGVGSLPLRLSGRVQD